MIDIKVLLTKVLQSIRPVVHSYSTSTTLANATDWFIDLFTAPCDCIYVGWVHTSWGSNNTGRRALRGYVKRNGTRTLNSIIHTVPATPSAATDQTIPVVLKLNSGDVFGMRVYQNGGASLTTWIELTGEYHKIIGGGYFLTALFSAIERWWRDVEIKGPACSNTPNRFSDRVWNGFKLDLQEIRKRQAGSGTCLERRTGYVKHDGILNVEKRWDDKYSHTANDDKWFSLCFFNGRLKQFRNSIRAYFEHIICHSERDKCERDAAKRNTCATNYRSPVEVVLVRGCIAC